MTSLRSTQQAVLYLELIRFSHTVFALPFAAVAALLAARVPLEDGSTVAVRLQDVLGIVLCMVLGRAAAMAFNRVVDRHFDAANERTKMRHLPAGQLTVGAVRVFCAVCCAGFVLATLLFLPNWLPLALSIPVLAWLLGYSYAKRFTAAAHLWLGLALALAPVCAWIALRGEHVLTYPADLLPALVLMAAIVTWVAGFDIIYACQDTEFDRRAGLHSVPARLGVDQALRLAAVLHGATAGLLFALPYTHPGLGLGWLYHAAWVAVVALLAYQHYLVRPDDLQRVGFAFFQVNAAISLVLMSCAAIDSWWG